MSVLKRRPFCVDMIGGKGIYLFLVLSRARVRRVCHGKFSSVLLTCDGYSKVLRDNPCMYVAHVCFYVCCSDSVGSVKIMFVVYQRLLKIVGFISHCEVLCVGYLCNGCDVRLVMHVIASISVWEGCWFRHAVVVYLRHVFQSLRAAFFTTCSLLMLVRDAIGDRSYG